MDYQLIGLICAGIGIVVSVLLAVLGFRAVNLLEAIRRRLEKPDGR